MKNILVCVTGLTPQVVTETLFCLSVQKKIKIDELYVITTKRGRDVILGTDDKINYPLLMKELKRMCEKYKMKQPLFEYNDKHIIVAKEQSIEVSDIRNDKQNKLFPNRICEFISDMTGRRENVLYCSISGGRKSMSVDMAFALSLFGRENDKLLHVLTHEDNEFKGFYPENKKEENDLELAELPYVKLRSILAKETKNKSFKGMKFTDIVEFTQRELKTAFADKLIINSKENSISYGEFEAFRLSPSEMKLYKYILSRRMAGEESVSMYDILNNCEHKFTKKGLVEKVSKMKSKFQHSIKDIDAEGKLLILGPEVFGTSNYGILLDSSKIKII